MSDTKRSHYFISLPVSDPSLTSTFNPKELVSLGLGLGLPLFFAFKLLKTDQLGRHSLLSVALLTVWLAICARTVLHNILSAVRTRQYANAVDSDAVELGCKLYTAEREANGIEKALSTDKYFTHFDFSLLEIEDLSLSDEVSQEGAEDVPDETESEKNSNPDVDNENS
ncbi:MAG TPA: hypothetical protein VFY61_10735 [Pyrinomonadaceae bacterium]|nr:hypothetical protein [Pyrinomonadaceae bacterium]